MTQMEFETQDKSFRAQYRRRKETPTLVRLLLKTGLAKSEAQANALLVFLVIIFLSLTFGIVYYKNKPSNIVTFPDGSQTTVQEYIEGLKSGKYK